MSMLKPAANKMAYLKCGIYGEAGSGKSVTSALIAIGLHKFADLKKPVGMFDTEGGASFLVPLFQKAGIPFLVAEGRSLSELMDFMDEAEKECSIAITDSITHIWRDVQESYLAKINEARANNNKRPIATLEFQDWAPIKRTWAKYTSRFLGSNLHCIVSGRAGAIYQYQKNERSGKMELITLGSKMATEKELGYEPSLLIEMVKIREEGKIINRALVEKDRSMNLNGKSFDFPTFDNFLPHIQVLNLGGQHVVPTDGKDSREMFTADGEDTFSHEKRQREIWGEEIKSLLVMHSLDGTSQEAKQKRIKLLQDVFGTGSWTAVENLRSERIKDGYEQMKIILGTPLDKEQDAALNQSVN